MLAMLLLIVVVGLFIYASILSLAFVAGLFWPETMWVKRMFNRGAHAAKVKIAQARVKRHGAEAYVDRDPLEHPATELRPGEETEPWDIVALRRQAGE